VTLGKEPPPGGSLLYFAYFAATVLLFELAIVIYWLGLIRPL
jgi:hypothetical protein